MPKLTITSLADIADAALRKLLGTRAFSTGALAIGSTKAKVKTAAAIGYCIGGVMYTKAATDDLFVHTDVPVQAADTTKYYALCLDATGAASVIQGTATALPVVPDTKCIVGYLKIVTTAAFTPATTDHDAAGITTTYHNISVPPVTLA